MEKLVFVWHGHHQGSSPLEELGESFKDREETITYQKSRFEGPKEIARRKQLFKRVKGGLKALPKNFQKVVERYFKAEKTLDKARKSYYNSEDGSAEDQRLTKLLEIADDYLRANYKYLAALETPSKEIMALHKKQCGCGWTPKLNDIFHYKP